MSSFGRTSQVCCAILSSLPAALTACQGTIGPAGSEPGPDASAAPWPEPGDRRPGDPAPDAAPPPDAPPSEAPPLIELAFATSDAALVNPERGFYVGLDLRATGVAARVRDQGQSVAIALVRLDDYRDAPLDAALLDDLERGFAEVRGAGIKVILRFMYNSAFTDDAPREVILGHIAQLAPLLHANADVIVVQQAGFIGAWGEWHRSTNGLDNDEDRAAILLALLDALPPERSVQIRTPMFKEAILPGGPLTDDEAFTASSRARVGHHNDCFLASDTDMGTYDAPVATWEAYVAQDGRFTPIGGETCRLYAPRTSCAAAIAEMTAMHWSYLNLQYHQDVLAAWNEEGCADEIERRLGYRFALQGGAVSAAVVPGGVLEVALELANLGFAAPFNARPVFLVLTGGDARWVAQLTAADPRRWAPGEVAALSARLRVPATAAPGTYRLSLWLPDDAGTLREDPRQAVRLANHDTWDPDTGENLLTQELRVDAGAGGPADPTAEHFVELR